MPIDTIYNPNEYDMTRFGANVTPRADGSITNTRNNFIEEQFARELGADGAPEPWDKVEGPTLDGYVPYITDVGGARATLQKQEPGGSPIPPSDDYYTFARSRISAGSPVRANQAGTVITAEEVENGALETPVVVLVPLTEVGFPQGEYWAGISFVGRGGAHTRVNPGLARLTINTNGQMLEYALLQDADRDLVHGQGLWLSEPAPLGTEPDATTLRLQKVVPNRGRTATLTGPYKWKGRLAPRQNETAIGKPEPFRKGRDFKLRGHQSNSLQQGDWIFFAVETSPVGDSLPSGSSKKINVNEDMDHHGIVFHRKKMHPEALGYKIFARNQDEGLLPTTYQLVRPRRAEMSRYYRKQERPVFQGILGEELVTFTDDTGEDTEKEKDKEPTRSRYVLIQADLPTEDASGLEEPTGDIDAPVVIGTGTLTPGRYGVGYSKRFSGTGISVSGGETQVSPLVYVDVPGTGSPSVATQAIRMYFPPRVNKIPNAMYGQLNQEKLPIGWAITGTGDAPQTITSTNINFEKAGVLYVETPGAITNAGRYPSVELPTTAGEPGETLIQVDGDRLEAIAGFLEVSNRASGRGYVELVQYDDDGTTVGTPVNVATLNANGKIWVEKTISKTNLTADITTLDPLTTYVGIRWGAENDTATVPTNARQLRVKWHSQIWSPFPGVPRRFQENTSLLEHWEATDDPATPYSSTHTLAIGSAPGTAGSAGNTVSPVASITSYDALTDGAEPTDSTNTAWTATVSNTGTGTAGAYSQPITVTNLTTNTITATLHGHAIGDPVQFYTTGTLPAPLVAGTTYYVITATANTLTVSATPGGTSVDITSVGSGTTMTTVFGERKTYRTNSTNTGSKSSAFMTRTITPTGDALGVVFDIYLEQMPTRNPSNVRIGSIMDGGVEMGALRLHRTGSSATAYRLDLVSTNASNKETAITLRSGLRAQDRLQVEVLVDGADTTEGSLSTSYGLNGGARGSGPGISGINFTGRSPDTVRLGGYNESHAETKWSFQYGDVFLAEGPYNPVTNTQPAGTAIPQADVPLATGTILATNNAAALPYLYTDPGTVTDLAGAVTLSYAAAPGAQETTAQIRNTAGTSIFEIRTNTNLTTEVWMGTTLAKVADLTTALATATNHRFELVLTGGGTTAGRAYVYKTTGTGERQLFYQRIDFDATTLVPDQFRVPGTTAATESTIVVSRAGELVEDTAGADGEDAYQEYVSIVPADVVAGEEKVGFDVDTFFVKPGVQRTAAVYVHAYDLDDAAAPFTIVEYDDDGNANELVSLWADGTHDTLAGNNGWLEIWTTYTPTQRRVRWEHRGMIRGEYSAYKRLDAVGNLNTRALRDAQRNENYAGAGIASVVLNSRIPNQSGTQMYGQWMETRQQLRVRADIPTGTTVTNRFRSASTVSGLTSATWQTDELLVPDLEWVEIEMTLTPTGTDAPLVAPGGAYVFYTCFQPVLLRSDRSPLPGGVYIGGSSDVNLRRPNRRSPWNTDAINDRAAPRALGARVGRIAGFPVSIFTADALDELMSDDVLLDDWVIETPFHNLVMRSRFYEPPGDPETLGEYEMLDEGTPMGSRTEFIPVEIQFERGAEMVESSLLVTGA